jgi:hypothetical protein
MRLVKLVYFTKNDFIKFMIYVNEKGFITKERAGEAGYDWDNYETVEDIIDQDGEMSEESLCDIVAVDYQVGWDAACDLVNDYVRLNTMEVTDANNDNI